MKPTWVIGARTFPAIDGATELDGPIYVFSEAQARTVVHLLRTEWIAARAETPDLDEALLLKRRFPVLIHRCWFDDDYFDAGEAPQESFGVGAVEPRHRLHTADLQNFHLVDPQLRDFAAFLHSSAAPTAMTIDRLHGFLTALNCAAKPIRPQSWMPLISGAEPMRFQSREHGEAIINAISVLSHDIARQLSDGTFEPLLPSRPGSGMEHLAQAWCIGFVEGMALQQRSWNELTNDPQAHMSVVPISILVDPSVLVEDATPNPATMADMVKLLPEAIALIFDHWAARRPTRGTGRALRGLSAHPPERARRGATATGSSSHTTAIWRRLEIPSNAQLPFVSRVLIAAMGWIDSHLHAFRVGSVTYGNPDPDFPSGMRSERSVTLAQIAPRAKDRFFFDYDFGDGWEHRVVVESIEPAGDSDDVRCSGGERACPPDDCGGVGGYRDLLKILGNSRNSEYRRMRMWAGDDFDSEFFDIEQVNTDLQRLVRSGRKRARRQLKERKCEVQLRLAKIELLQVRAELRIVDRYGHESDVPRLRHRGAQLDHRWQKWRQQLQARTLAAMGNLPTG